MFNHVVLRGWRGWQVVWFLNWVRLVIFVFLKKGRLATGLATEPQRHRGVPRREATMGMTFFSSPASLTALENKKTGSSRFR
jgi:hypothetical protein